LSIGDLQKKDEKWIPAGGEAAGGYPFFSSFVKCRSG
jgi:hypothetical protein